ncbi:MAG: carboxypeptidase-like regulatory domain-containing protein [Candidatus Latescibacterota bacterium]
MGGRLAALVGLAALLGRAAALGADTVEGYVVHGGTGERVPGVEVAFYTDQDGDPREVLRKTTDGEGTFAFAGPFLEPGLTFRLAAFYGGVSHLSTPLRVAGQQAVILEVFEAAPDDRAIRIGSHSLFLSVRGQVVEVAHVVRVDNTGGQTYAGQEVDGQRRVTHFLLPGGLFGLQSHTGDLVAAPASVFYDTQPLPPGQTQIAFSFTLDARELGHGYVHQVAYPTGRLEVFLQPAAFVPPAPFADLGLVELGGGQYRRVEVADLEPGRRLVVPLPLAPSWRWGVKWVALGVALLAAGLPLVLARRQTPAPQAPASAVLERRREELLLQLARLDQAHAGREEDAGYQAQRARLLEETMRVTVLMEGQDGGR